MRDFVVEWNHRFPMDLWWRRRHKVPFGSREHRDMGFLDILFDLQEEILVIEAALAARSPYLPGSGEWGQELTEADKEKMFDDLDLDSL